ncbi:MAG: hypothetical protein BRC47_04440 [Cyanobacteria bacterium QS_7_48_42]|nr:MAG: hypothetical protein BRC47_04440 [Cyanobacteria bacterium QS_7_48_42]PSP36720.1 MAG: hypothetical protein BRC57_00690 [Cyanobacteria bacterium QS_8_48_54]
MINGILWVLRTGCRGEFFPDKNTVATLRSPVASIDGNKLEFGKRFGRP